MEMDSHQRQAPTNILSARNIVAPVILNGCVVLGRIDEHASHGS